MYYQQVIGFCNCLVDKESKALISFLQYFLHYQSYMFFNGKLKLVNKLEPEYSLLKCYVFVFIMFPILLSISRTIKLINSLITYTKSKPNHIFLYIYTISYCLNGFFNSLLCLFFFRKGLTCCCKDKKTKSEDEKYKEMINRTVEKGKTI